MKYLWLLFFCTACATRYESATWYSNNGYSNEQLTADTFIVTFTGNSFTGANSTYKYALLRAAELALQSGHKYFLVLSAVDRTVAIQSSVLPGTSLSIKCFKDKPQSESAIDAQGYWDANRID